MTHEVNLKEQWQPAMINKSCFFLRSVNMGKLSSQQFVIFTSVYIAYTLYVYVRRSFSYAIPTLATEGKLDKTQLGKFFTIHLLLSKERSTCSIVALALCYMKNNSINKNTHQAQDFNYVVIFYVTQQLWFHSLFLIKFGQTLRFFQLLLCTCLSYCVYRCQYNKIVCNLNANMFENVTPSEFQNQRKLRIMYMYVISQASEFLSIDSL